MARRGQEVHWAGDQSYTYLQKAGVAFHRIDACGDALAKTDGRRLDSLQPEPAAELAEALFEPTREIAWTTQPDLIVCDTDAVHAPIVAESLGKPWASYSSGLFMNSMERRLFVEGLAAPPRPVNWLRFSRSSEARLQTERRLNRLRQRHGLAAVLNLDRVSDELHLLFTSRSFEFGGAVLPPQAKCLGPVFRSSYYLDPHPALSLIPFDDGEPFIYVHWPSSVAIGGKTTETVLASIRNAGLRALVETDLDIGNDDIMMRRLREPTARAEILQGASLVLCSGDFELVQEALSWGVPLFTVPCNKIETVVGLRIGELGLGRSHGGDALTCEALHDALESMVADRELRARTEEFALQVRIVDGASRGARYLTHLAANGRGACSHLENVRVTRLPECPRFGRHVRLASWPSGGLAIGTYLAQHDVEDADTIKVLEWLWERLDGKSAIGDVLESWNGGEDVLQLLDWLAERGLIEEGTGIERLSAESRSRFASQISMFAHAAGAPAPHPRHGGPAYQEKLLAARVGVLGTGVMGSVMIRDLALVGVGELRLVGRGTVDDRLIDQGGWYRRDQAGGDRLDTLREQLRALRPETRLTIDRDEAALRIDGLDLLVVAEDEFHSSTFRRVDEACHGAGVSWTSIRWNRWDVEIGPTIVPGMTACFECFEKRREGALASDSYCPQQLAVVDAGHLNVPLGGELLAFEAVKLLSGFGEMASLGRVLVLSPLQMALRSHRVLRLPSCHRCASRGETPVEAVWRAEVKGD